MIRDHCIQKYRYRWGGMVLYGISTDDPQLGALTRTQRVMNAPVEIDKLIGAMYDDIRQAVLAELQGQRTQPQPGNNGQKPTPAQAPKK